VGVHCTQNYIHLPNADLRSGVHCIPEEGSSNFLQHVGSPYRCDTVRYPKASTRNICTNTYYLFSAVKHNFNRVTFGFLDGGETFEINVIANVKMTLCLIKHHAMKKYGEMEVRE
jgi:hypothetical protein